VTEKASSNKRPYPYPFELREKCRNLNMPPTFHHILANIVSRVGKNNCCWVRQKTLASELGYARETVSRIVTVLVKKGILSYQLERIKINGSWVEVRTFRLHKSGLEKAKPWPLKNYKKITRTTQNGATVTITKDLSVTITLSMGK